MVGKLQDSYIDSDDVPSDVEYEMYRVAYNSSAKLDALDVPNGIELLADHAKIFALEVEEPLPEPTIIVEKDTSTVKETQTDFSLPLKIKDCWTIDYVDKRGFEAGRYFTPLRMVCYNCDEVGHLKYDCPKPKKETTCLNCGVVGHWFRECPRELCYNCGYPGHKAKECKMPRISPNKPCPRCRTPGHGEKLCPDIWRQFHSTTSVSQMSHGQPFRQSREMSRKPPSCYNCGRQGHWGFECSEETDNNTHRITQLVVRYDGLGLARQKKRKVKGKVGEVPSYSDTIVSDSSAKDAPKKHCHVIPRSKSLAYDLPKKQNVEKGRSKSLDETQNRAKFTNLSKKKSKSNKSLGSIENVKKDKKKEEIELIKIEQKPKFNKVKEELEKLRKASKADKGQKGNENIKKKNKEVKNIKTEDPWLHLPKSKSTPSPGQNLNRMKKAKPKVDSSAPKDASSNHNKKKGKKKNKKGTGFKKTCNVFS